MINTFYICGAKYNTAPSPILVSRLFAFFPFFSAPSTNHSHQQRFLLAEIIKASNVAEGRLLQIIMDENIEPNWNEIWVPPGELRLDMRLRHNAHSLELRWPQCLQQAKHFISYQSC
jgi:hypothetical protein